MRRSESERRMSNEPQRPPSGNVDDLQFDRVESAAPPPTPGVGMPPVAPPGVTVCAACGEPISDAYFEAAGKVVCPACRNAVLASQEKAGGFSGVLRSLLFAAGA